MYADPKDPNPPGPRTICWRRGFALSVLSFSMVQVMLFLWIRHRFLPGQERDRLSAVSCNRKRVTPSWHRKPSRAGSGGPLRGVDRSLIGRHLERPSGGYRGRDYARDGAVIGVSRGHGRSGRGRMAFQMQMERQIRLTLERDHLIQATLSPGGRHEGVVLCPAVDLKGIEILLEDPEYQWSQWIEVPLTYPVQDPSGEFPCWRFKA